MEEVLPKYEDNGNTEDSLQEKSDNSAPKEKSLSKSSQNDSEYDSAGSYSDDEGGKVRSRGDSGSASEGSVGIERQSGDGQESLPSKKVDDDEDKKNPQYIPKRGTFYEHDDRTADDENEEEAVVESEKDKDGKKKVWQDKKEKWGHDRFNDSEQAPKSRTELVAIYGYDIRNEEGPPRARRRRRYGRGPNKYTRNWEDEDAYNKPAPVRPKKPVRKSNGEDFPPLERQACDPEPEAPSDTQASEQSVEDNVSHEKAAPNEPKNVIETGKPNEKVVYEPQSQSSAPYQDSYRNQPRVGSGRVIKPKREMKEGDYRGFTSKTRQVRNVRNEGGRNEQRIMPKPARNDEYIQSQNFTNKNNGSQDLEREMAKLNVQDGVYRGGNKGRQGGVPPRLQAEQKGSKRYSSIRQRSLPESSNPPAYNQHANYYQNENYQQGPPVQIHPSNAQVAPQIAPPPMPSIAQVPVSATPILQAAPPQFAPPPFAQAPPPFLQAGVQPPPFIQQTPQIINYVPSQPQFPQGFQGYQQSFNAVTPPELYQQPTGITYYSTDQQVLQRAAPPKRQKAAIPIVAPPPLNLKGKLLKDGVSSYLNDVASSVDQQSGENNRLSDSNSNLSVQ